MEENFGCDPKNIEAYICPSILKCCFEVDKEVVDMFYENYNNIDDYVMKGDIKQGKQKEFEKLFNKYFKNDFILYTKEEVIKNRLFGPGKNNIYFEDTIGDFLAVATKDKYFLYNEHGKIFKSVHAGITEDEVVVPLIIYKS